MLILIGIIISYMSSYTVKKSADDEPKTDIYMQALCGNWI